VQASGFSSEDPEPHTVIKHTYGLAPPLNAHVVRFRNNPLD